MAQPGCRAQAAHHAGRADGYRRREPRATVLYQTVAKHWPAFRDRAEEAGGLPRFVEREFEEYLRCGLLEWGCLHLVCRSCGHSQLVALSCKRRGFCPACLGRRQLSLPALDDGADVKRRSTFSRNRWAWLLAHVFRADLDICPRCGGP